MEDEDQNQDQTPACKKCGKLMVYITDLEAKWSRVQVENERLTRQNERLQAQLDKALGAKEGVDKS